MRAGGAHRITGDAFGVDLLAAAVEEAVATAGRTVVFSGLTVAASLAGLLVFADPFLRSMAYGGGAVVLIDMLAAVTLLPALLGLWGRRVRPAPASQEGTGLFAAISRLVQRRAVLIVVVVAVPLAVAATPFLHAHYQQPDARFLPAGGLLRPDRALPDEPDGGRDELFAQRSCAGDSKS